ncbi:MAG: preprotein translocase subunit SecE [Clostridiales bacterium]|nr:preprotein translocase subunit SecE [Clostridiales bacterium]
MADDKVKEKKEKKKKEPGRIRRWFKDFFSELKKVTWPSFSKVLKQTGVVLLVTIIFLLVMMAFDGLFGLFYREFLVKRLSDGSATAAVAALVRGGGGLLL